MGITRSEKRVSPFMTAGQVRAALGVDADELARMQSMGAVAFISIGGVIRYLRASVDEHAEVAV